MLKEKEKKSIEFNFINLRIHKSKMEKVPDLKLPNDLCQQIFNNEFEIDIGNVN